MRHAESLIKNADAPQLDMQTEEMDHDKGECSNKFGGVGESPGASATGSNVNNGIDHVLLGVYSI